MRIIRRFRPLVLTLVAILPAAAQQGARPAAQSADPVASALRAIDWRSVGPANNAGRVSVVAGIPGDPSTYFVAGANGGIIKTTNGGTSPSGRCSTGSTIASIGAIAIAPCDPNVIYVGTGEENPRNNASVGERHVQVHRWRRALDAASGWRSRTRSPAS